MGLFRLCARLLVCVVVVYRGYVPCQNLPEADPNGAVFSEWARAHAIPLTTADPNHDLRDMQPLKSVIGNARIVGLGEATHGTREFFQLKHRMLEFLATDMGFSIFSIEANMPEAYRLNDYVLHGNGDPKELLKGMYFWTWDTEEVLDMILWMREFNRSGKGHVEFTGFDMQFPTVAMDTVRMFVTAQDNSFDTTLWPIYQDVGHLAQGSGALPLSGKESMVAVLLAQRCKEVVEHLQEHEANYARAGVSQEHIDWVIQNARIVMQYVQMKAGEKTRDESMADNIKWIADQNPSARIILWAHNGHISSFAGFPSYKPMGLYLKGIFGNEYLSFGFAFNQGSFQAFEMGKDLHDFKVTPAPVGTLDAALAASGIPIFALDLRAAAKNGQVSRWLASPHLTRSIGAVYAEEHASQYWLNSVAADSFSALLFVNNTSAAHKNPRGNVQFQSVKDSRNALGSEFRDPEYGVAFRLSRDWNFRFANHWGDQEATVVLNNSSTQMLSLYFRIFHNPEKISVDGTPAELLSEADSKVKQRRANGLNDYHLRTDSCHSRSLGAYVALSCIADFTDGGKSASEYLTFVRSDNALALFFARVAPADLESFRESADPVIESLQLPR